MNTSETDLGQATLLRSVFHQLHEVLLTRLLVAHMAGKVCRDQQVWIVDEAWPEITSNLSEISPGIILCWGLLVRRGYTRAENIAPWISSTVRSLSQ